MIDIMQYVAMSSVLNSEKPQNDAIKQLARHEMIAI